MRTSINQLNAELQAIADAHLQVNSYFWKDFLRSIQEEVVVYPMVNCYYPTGTVLSNATPIDLYIVVSDKVYKDLSNLNDTESDTLQICRDFYNIINRSNRWNRIGKVNSAIIDKFVERGADEVAGHVMKINFTLYDTNSICALPLEDYDMNGSAISSCEPVLIYENDVLIATVPSGGTYTIEQALANVQNSDLSYTATVQGGDTLNLPDVTIQALNSDSTILAGGDYPSVKNIDLSIPDTTIDIYVNNVLQETVTFATLSDQTINITN